MGVVNRILRAVAGPVLAIAVPFTASAQGLIRDAEIETILREYSDPLFVAAGIEPKDVKRYIVQSDEVNASVGGGRNMLIYTGLILQSKTPEELKGVIAHETGHLALGHNITRGITAGGAFQSTSLITMGLGALALFAGAPDAAMALFGSASTFGTLAAFKFTRAEEAAADIYAMDLLGKTQQSGEGFSRFMESFRYQELMTENRRDAYFRSHPIWSDRIGAVTKKAQEISLKARKQTPEEIEGLAMMQAKLVGFIGPPNRVLSRYPASDQSLPAKYARAIAAYKAVDIKAALTMTDELIAAEPENPYFQELKGQILFESGRAEESVAPHRRSVELAPQHALLKVNLARSLMATDTEAAITEAEGLLIDALALEQDNAFAWTFLADVYAKQGRVGDADLATAEAAYQVGNMSRAHIFSKRARDKLTLSTPNGQRADDIMALSDPRNRPGRSNRGFAGASLHTQH